MLHAKFQIIYSRFWGRILVKVYTIYGDGGLLGLVTLTIYTNFRSPFQGMLYMKFDYEWPGGFIEEDILTFVNGHTTTTTDAGALIGIL